MNKTFEELQLGESYQLSVLVENNGTCFAGDLSLSPEGCMLVVRGDIFEGRSSTLEWNEVDELQCTSFEGTFMLRGLKGIGGSRRTLQRYPESIGHFEIRYAISHIVFHRGQMFGPEKYVGFKIRSPSIARWIGATTTQRAIVAASEKVKEGFACRSCNSHGFKGKARVLEILVSWMVSVDVVNLVDLTRQFAGFQIQIEVHH
ncbi:MAG: hypothetical protein EPN31_06120 [Castellaniella sp.]|uniref:hypothetical protein n=1 Tax=Castellaniella sp. TaxID=1955812 RepID=UPI0011F83146|nr:hypothetical protein [Castellaniella sp.]TAN29648.1 MAG: hypothetical protein EPN31_06120 [Castellaniella sp.]